MKTFQNIEQAANLKGMAKHTYNRVMSAMAEDTTAGMLHAFAALTDGAKAIALRSGNFANTFIRGKQKSTSTKEAAKELAEIAAACVSRKLRKIDMVCAVAFLAEYISRQRKADEPTTIEPTDNTPSTMNANKTTANVLTLSKCAYIFHWSNSTYTYGNRDYRARKGAINNALKAIYDNPEKGANLPYTIESGRAFVEIDGLKIDICDTMLQSISGEYPRAEIVNGRMFKDLKPFYESFKPGTFTGLRKHGDQQYFWGAKLKSLQIESFPGVDSLRYYRLHFRGNRLDLIASNGKTYDAGGSNYAEITTAEILERLDAKSGASQKVITEFIKYIAA